MLTLPPKIPKIPLLVSPPSTATTLVKLPPHTGIKRKAEEDVDDTTPPQKGKEERHREEEQPDKTRRTLTSKERRAKHGSNNLEKSAYTTMKHIT